jgi:hypothetical protein
MTVSERLTDAEIALIERDAGEGLFTKQSLRTEVVQALAAEVRASRAASGGEVSCVQCAQNDDCPGFDACPWLPRSAGGDDTLSRIAALHRAWSDGDEPEGAPSARRTLMAIGEVLAEPRIARGGDDVAGALRDLLLSADCTWESNNGGHDWREACDRARSALALHRSGGGAAVRAARSLVSREDFWRAVRATGTVLPGEYDDLVDALRTAGSGGGDAREAGRKEGLEQAARALRHDPSVLASMNLEQIRDEVRSLPERVLALRAPSPDTGEQWAIDKLRTGFQKRQRVEAVRFTDLPGEIRAILRDVAHGIHGFDLSGRAAAAIVRRDLCPRCAGTGCDTRLQIVREARGESDGS